MSMKVFTISWIIVILFLLIFLAYNKLKSKETHGQSSKKNKAKGNTDRKLDSKKTNKEYTNTNNPLDAPVDKMYLLRDKLNVSKDEAEFNSIKQELINLIKDYSPKDPSGKHVSIAFIKEGGDPFEGIILSDIKKRVYKKEKQDIYDMFNRAMLLLNTGKSNEACVLYINVLELIHKDKGNIQNGDYYVCKPNDKQEEANIIPISTLVYYLGKCYLEFNQLNKAKKFFEQSIELNPSRWAYSHHYLGVVKILLGDFTTCINDFENALKIVESNWDSLFMLGVAYSNDKCEVRNLEKATEYLKKYLQIKPEDNSALSLINEVENEKLMLFIENEQLKVFGVEDYFKLENKIVNNFKKELKSHKLEVYFLEVVRTLAFTLKVSSLKDENLHKEIGAGFYHTIYGDVSKSKEDEELKNLIKENYTDNYNLLYLLGSLKVKLNAANIDDDRLYWDIEGAKARFLASAMAVKEIGMTSKDLKIASATFEMLTKKYAN